MGYREQREEFEIAKQLERRATIKHETSCTEYHGTHKRKQAVIIDPLEKTLLEYIRVALKKKRIREEIDGFDISEKMITNYDRVGHGNTKHDISDIIVKKEELFDELFQLIDKVFSYCDVIDKLPIDEMDKHYLRMVYVYGKKPINSSKTKRIIAKMNEKGLSLLLHR